MVGSYAKLEVTTGKGINSRGGISVLKPLLKEWCDRNGFGCNVTEAIVEVFVEVRKWWSHKGIYNIVYTELKMERKQAKPIYVGSRTARGQTLPHDYAEACELYLLLS